MSIVTNYSCLDCKHLKSCLESSRRYPCRDFKLAEPAILERRGRKHESEKILECLIPSKTIQAVLDNTADERTITRFINAKNTVKKIYARVGNILLQELMVRKLLGYGVDIGKIEMLCKKRITLQDIQKNPYLTLLRFGIPITASEMFAWDNGLRDEYSLKRLCGFTYDLTLQGNAEIRVVNLADCLI